MKYYFSYNFTCYIGQTDSVQNSDLKRKYTRIYKLYAIQLTFCIHSYTYTYFNVMPLCLLNENHN